MMDDRTKVALEESIAHWRKNAAAVNPEDVKMGASSCALCDLFYDKSCEGCPVVERTKQQLCANTPYHLASYAFGFWRRRDEKEDKEIFLDAAQKELDFLISLREG